MIPYGNQIMKNGMYLSHEPVYEEADYWEPTEMYMNIKSSYHWNPDIEKAKCFVDKQTAQYFLRNQKGEFWEGAKVV